jgi:signal transduction histidine kinase
VIVASTALSALIIVVLDRLHDSRAALVRGLPEIERRARDRANDAARRRIDEERRVAADARSDVDDMQQRLRQRDAAASASAAARAGYLQTVRRAVRLPLGALEYHAARLGMTTEDAITPQQQRDVNAIRASQEHIATVVDTLLLPARVESANIVPAVGDVSLASVVDQAAALVRPYLDRRESTLEYETLAVPNVRADAVILTQVLARLLLDESRRAPGRTLRLEAHERDDGVALECRITDEERLTSLPESDAEDVESVVSSSRSPAELLRQMGGALAIGSEPGAGSGFTIWLATRAAAGAMDASAPVTVWPPIAFELPRARRIGG